jgi:hypothetical protein
MSTNLRTLAKALREAAQSYADRTLIDYWRTIQGTPVGFHGKEGEGVPIAGPAILTGSTGSGNPLLAPLLDKYEAGTFIGDALRKKNFPISTINFIEKFVGGTDAEIKAKFAATRKELEAAHANMNKHSSYDPQTATRIAEEGDPEVYEVKGGAYGFRHMVVGPRVLRQFIEPRMGESNADEKSEVRRAALNILSGHFVDPSGESSHLYSFIGSNGVSGKPSSNDSSEKSSSSFAAFMRRQMQMTSNTYRHFDADQKYIDGAENAMKLSDKELEKEVMDVIGKVYVLNQIAMSDKKTQRIVRSTGESLPNLTEDESKEVMSQIKEEGVSSRFAQRSVSGYALLGDDKSKSVNKSIFGGYTVIADVPVEAMLSSFNGLCVQRVSLKYSFNNVGDRDDNDTFAWKAKYADERENLVIGASEIQFKPEDLNYVKM